VLRTRSLEDDPPVKPVLSLIAKTLLLLGIATAPMSAAGATSELEQFFGKYAGPAVTDEQGSITNRDLRVEISPHKQGFTVRWVSQSWLGGGEVKRKNYIIDFYPTTRPHIFQAGMRTDKFGHQVPLDPMRGEPYIWARVAGPSLFIHALHVLEDGGYEVQTYVRTATTQGLNIQYSRRRDGKLLRSVTGLLKRQDQG